MAILNILFVTRQNEIVQDLEQGMLKGHFIDIAKKGAAAKHFLRGNTCPYHLIIIDERLEDMPGHILMEWIYTKHPAAHVAGVSENLSAWPEMAGQFSHIAKYFNSGNNSLAWRKADLERIFLAIT